MKPSAANASFMLHRGQVLSQGSPQQVAALAQGRSFVATPEPGQSARSLQAILLDRPDIIDAVPDGGRVRFVRRCAPSAASTCSHDLSRHLCGAALRRWFHDTAAGALRS